MTQEMQAIHQNEKIIEHDTQIKNLTDMVSKVDKKIDKIDGKLNQINIDIHNDNHDIDRRVTAVESKIETLKWGFGAIIVIVTVLQFFLTHMH